MCVYFNTLVAFEYVCLAQHQLCLAVFLISRRNLRIISFNEKMIKESNQQKALQRAIITLMNYESHKPKRGNVDNKNIKLKKTHYQVCLYACTQPHNLVHIENLFLAGVPASRATCMLRREGLKEQFPVWPSVDLK